MAPITRRMAASAAAEAAERSRCAVADNPELLNLIFRHLPPLDRAVTVPRLCSEWRRRFEPRAAAVRKEARSARDETRSSRTMRWNEPAPPLWALQEAWPNIGSYQRFGFALGAAVRGDLAAVVWMHDNSTPKRDFSNAPLLCDAAALGGQRETLQWLHSNGYGPSKRACAAAAEGGHLETLQWLRANGCEWDPVPCPCDGEGPGFMEIVAAVRGGHLEIAQWLHSIGCPLHADHCTAAASAGRLDVLRWLHSKRCPWNAEACTFAAKAGHLEVLQYLHSKRRRHFTRDCPVAAAEEGRLDILQWLHSIGCPWDAEACAGAAEGGHLEVLQYLRASGCPWDAYSWAAAVRYGRLEVLRWLHANNAPFNESSWAWAATNGHMEVLEFLYDNGYPVVLEGVPHYMSQFYHPLWFAWLKERGLLAA